MAADYKKILSLTPPRLIIATSASAALRYPVWLFMVNGSALQQTSLWRDDCALLCNWDCNYFAKLTQALEPHAFFPLFPATAHLYQMLTDTSANVAVLLTSNLFTWIAGILTLFVGNALWPGERQFFGFSAKSWLLLLALSLFPHSHFWVRGYSESLFFCCSVGVVMALVARRWELGAWLAGLSAITRPQGIALLAAFAVVLVWGTVRRQTSAGRAVAALFLALLPFGIFLAWNNQMTGDPFYFVTAQREGWHRSFSLMQGLAAHLPALDENHCFLYGSYAAAWYFTKCARLYRPARGSDAAVSTSSEVFGGSFIFLAVSTLVLAELPLFVGGFYSYGRFMSTNLGLLCLVAAACKQPAVAAGLGVWAVANLACNTHAVLFSFWTG